MSNKVQLETAHIVATPQGVLIKTPQGVEIELVLGPETVFHSARNSFNGAPVRVPLMQDPQELAAALRCRQPKRLEYRASRLRERLLALRKDQKSFRKSVQPKEALVSSMPPEMAAKLDAALKK